MASTQHPSPAPPSPEATGTTDRAAGPSDDVALLASPEFVANTFSEYVAAWVKRVRGGESGVLPVLVGLVIIIVIFRIESPVFLSAGNLVNLLDQSAVFVLLGMAEVFVLLLGEIDLSIGYVAGLGGALTVYLSGAPDHLPWVPAVLAGLAVTAAIGAIQGALITRLNLPSFVVTLAGLLGWQGVLLWFIQREGGSNGGTLRVTNNFINDVVNGTLDPWAGWVFMILAVAAFAALAVGRDMRRRAAGLVAPPFAVTVLKIATLAVAGVVLVLVCNADRGTRFAALRGVPWVVPIVAGIVVIYTFFLGRTRFGRYVYAVGGNAEAARRAGINLGMIRLVCFALAGFTAGIGGIVYASRLGSISQNVDGGNQVLYAVAAAVIGGTSLFGGRGKIVHALIGGLVIGSIYNGMYLLGLSAQAQDMVTGLVLLAAVVVDALSRRGRTTTR